MPLSVGSPTAGLMLEVCTCSPSGCFLNSLMFPDPRGEPGLCQARLGHWSGKHFFEVLGLSAGLNLLKCKFCQFCAKFSVTSSWEFDTV